MSIVRLAKRARKKNVPLESESYLPKCQHGRDGKSHVMVLCNTALWIQHHCLQYRSVYNDDKVIKSD